MYHTEVPHVEKQLENLLYGTSHEEGNIPSTLSTSNRRSLWAAHDHRVERINEASSRPSSNSRANAINLIREYKLHPMIARHEDPLQWWKSKSDHCLLKHFLPLSETINCISATSVPSEQVFSHASDLISAKRSRLSGSTVEMLLFLNRYNSLNH